MEQFTFESLEGTEGSLVKVIGQNGNVDVTIASLERTKLNGERWDTFCVLLKGDANEPLEQGTYKLQHESFGEAELFLSPNSETEYEIHVSREKV